MAGTSSIAPSMRRSDLAHCFPEVIGHSNALVHALSLLDRVTDTDYPVLFIGETGTGKEVFARALHAAGPRASAPFVAVNCTAMPPSLFEAELLGHRKGAFTGALRDHQGLVRSAQGGTLFLDEIGDLPLELQPKLLRLLQNKRVRPVGGDVEAPVDVRVVAATHHGLRKAVVDGRFRSDLYYRLSVLEVRVPPLCERIDDVPELAAHILKRLGRADLSFSPEAMHRLMRYAWPGNVRQLENEVQRASLFARSRPVQEAHLSPNLRRKAVHPVGQGLLAQRIAEFEREVLTDTLGMTRGNKSHAARLLGISRQALLQKLARLGLHGTAW
jgi:DNA-binding NtrC family response regulator